MTASELRAVAGVPLEHNVYDTCETYSFRGTPEGDGPTFYFFPPADYPIFVPSPPYPAADTLVGITFGNTMYGRPVKTAKGIGVD